MMAWRTRLIGIECIVFAETRSKARAATVRGAMDAGYNGVTFLSPASVRRAPELDRFAPSHKPHECLGEQYIARSA